MRAKPKSADHFSILARAHSQIRIIDFKRERSSPTTVGIIDHVCRQMCESCVRSQKNAHLIKCKSGSNEEARLHTLQNECGAPISSATKTCTHPLLELRGKLVLILPLLSVCTILRDKEAITQTHGCIDNGLRFLPLLHTILGHLLNLQ